jgi:hypothetical protein
MVRCICIYKWLLYKKKSNQTTMLLVACSVACFAILSKTIITYMYSTSPYVSQNTHSNTERQGNRYMPLPKEYNL